MTEFILDLIESAGYLGIALLMFLENVFPPIPSEVIMGLGGIAVAQGRMEIVPLLVAGTIGTTLGNLVWYWVGRRIGYQRLRPFVDRWGRVLTLEWEDVEKLHRIFLKYGSGIVFFIRFTPTFRTMISLPAGLVRMKLGKFLLWTAAGAGIWNAVLAYAGIWLGSNFESLQAYIGPVAVATVVLAVLGYLYRLFTWKPRARRP